MEGEVEQEGDRPEEGAEPGAGEEDPGVDPRGGVPTPGEMQRETGATISMKVEQEEPGEGVGSSRREDQLNWSSPIWTLEVRERKIGDIKCV